MSCEEGCSLSAYISLQDSRDQDASGRDFTGILAFALRLGSQLYHASWSEVGMLTVWDRGSGGG